MTNEPTTLFGRKNNTYINVILVILWKFLFQQWKIWEERFATRRKFFKGPSNNTHPKAEISEETKIKDVQVANATTGNITSLKLTEELKVS